MQAAHINRSGTTFLVYTGLGYLALILHLAFFGPGLSEASSRVRVALVLVNLAAGSWCFVRALRAGWTRRVPTGQG
jgi:hypothetical protein